MGASLEGAELRLLNRLGRAEAKATLDTLRMATGEKIKFASDNLLDSIDSLNVAAQQILLEKNRSLASHALASIGSLNQQRSQIVEIIKKFAGP